MRAALLSLMGELAERDGVIARQGQEAVFKQVQIDKLTHENALLKRMKFAAQRGALQRRAEEPAR